MNDDFNIYLKKQGHSFKAEIFTPNLDHLPKPTDIARAVSCPYPQFKSYFINGDNAFDFLQGQLSCDLKLAQEQPTIGAYCNQKGRVLSIFHITSYQDGFLMLIPYNYQKTIRQLNKYAKFSKVAIKETEHTTLAFSSLDNTTVAQDDVLIPIPQNPMLYFYLTTDPIAIMSNILSHASLCSSDEFNAKLIQSNYPFITEQNSLEFLPQVLQLEKYNGVSFTKGCFLGQEIIARLQHLGKVKKSLDHTVIEAEKRPQAGEEILHPKNGQKGIVLYTSQKSSKQYLILAVWQN